MPENLALGVSLGEGTGGLALLAAIFVSNLPEALVGSASMRSQGMSASAIIRLWGLCSVVLVIAVVIGAGPLSGSSPETISFWELPAFIRVLENAGFSAVRHRLYWHRLLAGPLLLFAMVLLAATFSLRPPRRGGTLALALAGIAAGFLLYFVSNVVAALGQNASIPVALAAWTPVGVSTLVAVTLLLHLEDG